MREGRACPKASRAGSTPVTPAKLARAVSVVCNAMLWRSSRLHRAMPADQRSHGADPAAEAEAEGKIA